MTYRKVVCQGPDCYLTKVNEDGSEKVISSNTHWPRYKMD
jgi:hypothetical protein